MDFQIYARVQEYQVVHLEEIIHARHGDPIQNLVLYKGVPKEEAKLPKGSTDTLHKVGESTIFYDYNPPLDPFCNRPMAAQLFASNMTITLQTFENDEKPVIVRRLPLEL